jgi:hypothetical protein
MRHFFLKAAFLVTVTVLAVVLLIPAYLFLEFVMPSGRGGDRLFLGVVVVFFVFWVADRVSSLAFWKARLSDERWSIFTNRRRRKSA